MDMVLHFNYNVIIFIILAAVKVAVESYAGTRERRKEKGGSHSISIVFFILGFGTPVLIFIEVVLIGHTLPLWISIVFAAISLVTQFGRFYTLRILGKYFTVDVVVFKDHELVQKGPYRYVRHPLYMLGIFDYPAYPLACGAFLSAIPIALIGWGAIFFRRRYEEKKLLEKFGTKYEEYKKKTWF